MGSGSSQQLRLSPPLKWAGGKRWLVPLLRPLWLPYRQRRYVEPFSGGLGMALGLGPAQALLSDINPHVIGFYRHLQAGLEITLPMANDRELYYRHRRRFNELLALGQGNTQEAASLFYYLNRTGFNGLCRFNHKGQFNVPFGRYKTITYRRTFAEYQDRFRDWQFQNGDFATLDLDPDDFVYGDPPYDVEFRQYSQGGFSWQDQVRTAEWLSRHRGPVLLSNQATPRIMELYEKLGFQLRLVQGPRLISCTGKRQPAWEVLAWRHL